MDRAFQVATTGGYGWHRWQARPPGSVPRQVSTDSRSELSAGGGQVG